VSKPTRLTTAPITQDEQPYADEFSASPNVSNAKRRASKPLWQEDRRVNCNPTDKAFPYTVPSEGARGAGQVVGASPFSATSPSETGEGTH